MAATLVWWIDRCLGTDHVPARLRALGVEVRLYRDLFPDDSGVADADWIPEVTARGWCILTKDGAIRTNAEERRILLRARARYVSLASAKLRGEEQADVLAHHWRTIEGVVAARRAPLILNVTKTEVQEWKLRPGQDGAGTWHRVPHKARR